MNKKAWYTFRIVLGGYLAWLGIRMLIEMVNEKPNNMVFMCVMSVIFILIGLAYAIYYVKKMFDLKKEDHRIEEEDKEAFDAGKDQADRKRRKNVLPEIGPNEEMKKEAEQGKTDKETAQSGNNIEKEAEKLDDKAEGETEKSGYKAGSETEQSDDKVKKEDDIERALGIPTLAVIPDRKDYIDDHGGSKKKKGKRRRQSKWRNKR